MPSMSESAPYQSCSVVDRPAGAAELAEDFWRLSKADNQEIKVDRVLHATHGLQAF